MYSPRRMLAFQQIRNYNWDTLYVPSVTVLVTFLPNLIDINNSIPGINSLHFNYSSMCHTFLPLKRNEFFFFFSALAFTILQTNATLLNLTQRMQASNLEFSLISWISTKHYTVPDTGRKLRAGFPGGLQLMPPCCSSVL